MSAAHSPDSYPIPEHRAPTGTESPSPARRLGTIAAYGAGALGIKHGLDSSLFAETAASNPVAELVVIPSSLALIALRGQIAERAPYTFQSQVVDRLVPPRFRASRLERKADQAEKDLKNTEILHEWMMHGKPITEKRINRDGNNAAEYDEWVRLGRPETTKKYALGGVEEEFNPTDHVRPESALGKKGRQLKNIGRRFMGKKSQTYEQSANYGTPSRAYNRTVDMLAYRHGKRNHARYHARNQSEWFFKSVGGLRTAMDQRAYTNSVDEHGKAVHHVQHINHKSHEKSVGKSERKIDRLEKRYDKVQERFDKKDDRRVIYKKVARATGRGIKTGVFKGAKASVATAKGALRASTATGRGARKAASATVKRTKSTGKSVKKFMRRSP